MLLSARNQIPGTIVDVQEGAVNAIVKLDAGQFTVSGTISMNAVKELGLVPGKKAIAVIKATDVMVGLGTFRLSARNQFPGTVVKVQEGAVNAIVSLDVGGTIFSATISMNAVKELGLVPGAAATAVIKATSVMFGVED